MEGKEYEMKDTGKKVTIYNLEDKGFSNHEWIDDPELHINMIRRKTGNALLSLEQYRYLAAKVYRAAEADRVGRKLFDIKSNIGGFGTQMYSYDELTEMGAAILSNVLENHFDAINLTRNNRDIPILQNGFRIEERDRLANLNNAIPLPTKSASSAGRSVRDAEENLLLNTFNAVNGLYASATQTFAGADWAVAGNPTATVEGGMALLYLANIEGNFHLVLNPTQYLELMGNVLAGGLREFDHVKAMIGGEIFKSRFQTAGTGMLVAVPGSGYEYNVLAIAQDLTQRDWDINGIATGFNVYEAVLPVIQETDATCTLTGI